MALLKKQNKSRNWPKEMQASDFLEEFKITILKTLSEVREKADN